MPRAMPAQQDLPDPLASWALTPEEQASFDAWTHRFILRVWPTMGWLLAVAAVAWWPTDAWLFPPGSPERDGLSRLRLTTTPLNLVLPWLLPRVAWAHAHPVATVSAAVIAESALAGSAVGEMGERWIGFLYLAPLFTALIPTALPSRALVATATGAAAWLGFAACAAHPPSDLLASSALFSAFGVLLSVAVGHLAWSAMRAAQVSRDRVASLAASLQAQVDDQTATLRRVLQQADTAREDERTTIARELHDELGQELAALRITLALGRSHPGPAILDELDRLLDRTGRTVRRMLLTLRPRALDELGLVGGLAWLAEETTSRGLPCEVHVPEALALDPNVEQALFRCAQEALTNVVRHAQASHAVVRVSRLPDGVMLEVSDDGMGLPADDLGQRGLGLLGIRERARALGGSATWTGNGGTRLVVHLPIGVPP